jgi:drug/metabolite transporter (DMT)-like permease
MKNIGVLFTALSGILYGSIGYFGIRLQEEGLTLSDLLFWRFFFSVILLFPAALFVWFKDKKAKYYFSLFFLFIFGIILYGVGTAFYFEAGKTIGTGLAMVIFFTYPLFVAGLSYFVHQIPLSKAVFASLVLIVFGCMLIAFGDDFHAKRDHFGILLAAFSGIGYGLYIFFSKKIANEITPILATFVVCLGSSITFILHTLITQRSFYWPTSGTIWTLIAAFSLIGTVLPVLFMLIGLQSISANKASIISVVEPVTVLVVGIFILNETVTGTQLLGAVIILCSAVIIQLDKSD